MKKAKKVLKETVSNLEYRRALNELVSGCPICGLGKGCNRRDKFTHDEHCWKSNRIHQWKD